MLCMVVSKLPDGSVGWKMKTYAQSLYWLGLSNAPGEWINIYISMPIGCPEIISISPVDENIFRKVKGSKHTCLLKPRLG